MANDPVDKIVMDVPLFIRVLELTMEHVRQDMVLHEIATLIQERSRNSYTLTMKDYPEIAKIAGVSASEKSGDEDEEKEDVPSMKSLMEAMNKLTNRVS
jgi:hypothetical protein